MGYFHNKLTTMEVASRIPPSVCFQVDKIIGVSVGTGNTRNYQIQWAPTWVSAVHLVGCDDLIAAFVNQMNDNGHQKGITANDVTPETEITDNVFDSRKRLSD